MWWQRACHQTNIARLPIGFYLLQLPALLPRCPPEFVYLYREFGGDLWIRDSRQRLATEISDNAPSLQLMKQLQGSLAFSKYYMP